jgi:DNA-binding MarR family transcriptional regulator
MSNYISVTISPDFEKRYPEASAAATECTMNLILTADLLEKNIAALLTPFDLTPASALVLSLLADAEEPLSPNHIADRLIISRASVTSLLDSLEKRNYARRRPHPSDRRMIWVEPTDLGRQIADDFRPVVHRNQKIWLGVLSEKEQELLMDMLHRAQARLMEQGTE